jgi:CsoR family transcriptional regulator, copper-sensing transcriptional repressor
MKNSKSNLIHRIKIIKGHITAIEKMIENDEYCIKVVHQSLAVQKALKNLDAKIMESHITHCVAEQAKMGNTKQITEELLSIYSYK